MRLFRRALLVAVPALALIGCTSADPTPSPPATATLAPTASVGPSGSADTSPTETSPTSTPAPSATPSPPDSGTAPPTGAPTDDFAIVRIGQTGGMSPPWMTLNSYPLAVLYADGRIITEGPQIEIYPGPALPNLVETIITPAGVEQVLAWATDAGLEGEPRFLGELIPDAPVTTFTIVHGDSVHQTTVTDLSLPDPEVVAAARFLEMLASIVEWLPAEVISDGQPFQWSSLQILAAPADPAAQPDPQLVTISEWPLQDLATVGVVVDEVAGYRCALVEGAELDVLRPALESATELTFWRSEGQTYAVQFHPLLPGDPPCPGLAGP